MPVISKNRIIDAANAAMQTRGALTRRQAMRAAFAAIRAAGCIETGCKIVWRAAFKAGL